MKNVIFLSVLFLLLSCIKKEKSPFEQTNIFEEAVPLGEPGKKLEEASGLVASIKNPGYFWTHNDSGNGAEVFLIDEEARIKLTCVLKGIKNRDWEDIAIGPGADEGKIYIYIADIGDNEAIYPLKYIYRFEEPVLNLEKKIEITQIDTLTFQLQGEKKDTEAMLLHPQTKDLYFISKREKPVWVYQLKFPYASTDTLTAIPILSLPFTKVTAADISPNGKEVLIKNYNNIFYWRIQEGKSLAETLNEKPLTVPYDPEPQGEAIAWARDTTGFYTLSEKVKGKKSILFLFKRR
jgi:hypothetical protein